MMSHYNPFYVLSRIVGEQIVFDNSPKQAKNVIVWFEIIPKFGVQYTQIKSYARVILFLWSKAFSVDLWISGR